MVHGESKADVSNLARYGLGRRTGVTLFELMVACAIVGALLAIVAVALVPAREAARGTRCASNLQQIGRLLAAYAADNRGYIPRGGDYNAPAPSWIESIARLLRGNTALRWADLPHIGVLQCPAHPLHDIPSGYVMNAFALETAPHWAVSSSIQWSKVRQPAQTPWVLDAADRFGPAPYLPYDAIYFEPHHVLFMPQHLTERVGVLRHKNRHNVLHFDGHVNASTVRRYAVDDFDDGIRAR